MDASKDYRHHGGLRVQLRPARGDRPCFGLRQQRHKFRTADLLRRLAGHLFRLVMVVIDGQHRHQCCGLI